MTTKAATRTFRVDDTSRSQTTDETRHGELRTVERIDELVGQTPLVKLNSVVDGDGPDVYVKMESLNPSGSIRDRYIREIITRAVDAGYIVAGDALAIAGIDDSSVAAALLTNLLELDLKVFAPSHSSRRLMPLIERYGADIEWTDEEDGLPAAIDQAASWARQAADRMYVDGYRRQAVNDAYTLMADEILQALHGRILGAFITSVTTGGTFRHVARELRQTHPALQVGGAVLTDAEFPELQGHAYNRLRRVSLKEAWQMRDRVAQEEGLLLGPKGAAAVLLAIEMRADISEDAIVALNPDSGQRYLGWETKPLFEVTFQPDAAL
jgi:cysteine synthase A